MELTTLFNNLPKEIQLLIYEYNPEHRVLLNDVLCELNYVVNCTYCDNDMCEKEIYVNDEGIIHKDIFGCTYYFCSGYCDSYGTWSIGYDYRKHNRRNHS